LAAGVLLIVVAGVSLQWNSKQHKTSSQPLTKQVETSKGQSTLAQNNLNSNVQEQHAAVHAPSYKNNFPQSVSKSQNSKSKSVSAKSTQIPALASPNSLSMVLADGDVLVTDFMHFDLVQPQVGKADFSELNGLGLVSTQIESKNIEEIEASLKSNNEKLKPLNWFEPRRMPEVLGRWSVEVGADANQTGLMYRANSAYEQYVHKNYFDRMKSGEFALSASRIQGALMYQLSKNHSVKVGLAYAENRTEQKFDFRDSMPATVIQGQSADALGYYPIFGYLGLGPQVKFNSQSTYTMLSIPMGYTGHFALRKDLYVTPEVLISANRLGVSAGAQTLDYQTLLQKAQVQAQFRTWVVGARFALGVEKRLNYSQAIGLRFNAQSMLSPMYLPNAALESRGWSAGLSAHYSWRIQ
jgi:hypothetical protein